MLVVHGAPVAQLDSASVFGTEGYRFESCRAYLTGKELLRGPTALPPIFRFLLGFSSGSGRRASGWPATTLLGQGLTPTRGVRQLSLAHDESQVRNVDDGRGDRQMSPRGTGQGHPRTRFSLASRGRSGCPVKKSRQRARRDGVPRSLAGTAWRERQTMPSPSVATATASMNFDGSNAAIATELEDSATEIR